MDGSDEQLEGTVRVTFVDTIASHVLIPCLAALARRNPEIAVDLEVEVRHLSLAMREADIAMRLRRFEGHDLVARRVGALAHDLYASPAYLDRHGPLDFTSGCMDHRLITKMDAAEAPQVGRWLAEAAPRAMVTLRTDSPAAQVNAALRGSGITCLP